jgi:hypothetical protein
MIYVLGCNHGIQPRDPDWLVGDTNQAAEQRAHFAQLIDTSVNESEAQFVAEEWGLSCTTRAASIADRHGIPWSNVNTSFHDLNELGMPHDYVNGAYSNEEKEKWNRERDKVMLEKIKAAKKEAANGVIICGFEHMDPLVELLEEEGIEAKSGSLVLAGCTTLAVLGSFRVVGICQVLRHHSLRIEEGPVDRNGGTHHFGVCRGSLIEHWQNRVFQLVIH